MTGLRVAVGQVAASAVSLGVQLVPAASSLGPVRRLTRSPLSGIGDPQHVALTFDDGPDPSSTPAFLRLLRELDVRATFFLLGRMLEREPWLGRALLAEGHEVALHGWDHRPLILRTPQATRADLARGHELVTRVCGQAPAFYRPPYGVMSRAADGAATQLHMTPVLWSTWGRDWRRAATSATVATDVARHLGPGGTILLHDSDSTSTPDAWRATLAALPAIVGEIRSRGLTPGPLAEHGVCRGPVPPPRLVGAS